MFYLLQAMACWWVYADITYQQTSLCIVLCLYERFYFMLLKKFHFSFTYCQNQYRWISSTSSTPANSKSSLEEKFLSQKPQSSGLFFLLCVYSKYAELFATASLVIEWDGTGGFVYIKTLPWSTCKPEMPFAFSLKKIKNLFFESSLELESSKWAERGVHVG